jgi:tetratricopeptide (TPR) repeat protein
VHLEQCFRVTIVRGGRHNFDDSKRHRTLSSEAFAVKVGGMMIKIALAGLIAGGICVSARAQDPAAPPPPNHSQDQKPPAADPGTKPDAKPDSHQPPIPIGATAPDAPSPPVSAEKSEVYDPYKANKDIEVGLYYQRKGDLNAAIERYKDAIHYKYDFARPRILLGEAYEKQHDDAEALRYYKEYLKILPNGPDAKHARERIDKLSKKDSAEK